jgi:wyosine [tRNA(Phe)-imidazoG37] synthetase (radical SAM superfamily)
MSVIESVKNSTIFGPIHSRRFGVSLGIDLSPSHKQCNFDCLYCELSPAKTMDKQDDIVEVSQVIEALKNHLDDTIDVITITANGEPTLYPHLDELITEIAKIKKETQTLILTNSASLEDEKVFQTLLKFDQVKLSLDAVTQNIFKKIDRPFKSITIEKIVESVLAFSKAYSGKLYIEILFVAGVNNSQDEITKLNATLLELENIQRVDIGTIDRPPAYDVKAVSYEELHKIAMMFDPSLPIHIASRSKGKSVTSFYERDAILTTLEKRPLTQDDVDFLFDESTKVELQKLKDEKKVSQKEMGGLTFYVVS